MERANEAQERSNAQRNLRSEESERGSIGLALVGAVGVLAIASTTALGLANYARNHETVTAEVTVSPGKGQLTGVHALSVPEACFGVYQNDVKGATAKFDTKVDFLIFGKHSIGNSATSTFNGNLTSRVCHDAMALTFQYNDETDKYDVTVPLDTYHTEISRTNPAANYFTHDNGPLMAMQKNIENEINVIPKLSANRSDDLYGRLDGIAELAAQETSARACGDMAWPYLEPLEIKGFQQQLLAEAARWRPDLALTADDFNVQMTGEVHFTTQYKDELEKIRAAAKKANVTIPTIDEKKLVCTVNPQLEQQLKQQADGATS